MCTNLNNIQSTQKNSTENAEFEQFCDILGGFTDNELIPLSVADLRKEAKKRGLNNDDVNKVVKQRRRVKVRSYSKNFRERDVQLMADMEVNLRVLQMQKERLLHERYLIMRDVNIYKSLIHQENNHHHHQQHNHNNHNNRPQYLGVVYASPPQSIASSVSEYISPGMHSPSIDINNNNNSNNTCLIPNTNTM